MTPVASVDVHLADRCTLPVVGNQSHLSDPNIELRMVNPMPSGDWPPKETSVPLKEVNLLDMLVPIPVESMGNCSM